jgi:LTXXQ motif family protein
VRDAAKMRMEHMQGMMERMDEMRRTDNDMEEGEGMSPVDRLDRMASRLTQAGAALQKVADAAKPLYASLDDSQKRIFGFLSHEMMTMGHGPGGMGPQGGHHRYHEEEGGPEEE